MTLLAKKTDLQWERKVWHMVTGLSALGLTFLFKLDSFDAAFLSFLIGLGGLLFELIRLSNSKLNDFFILIAGRILRERERTKVSGFTYYCFGVSLCFFFFPWKIAILSVLFLIFADPTASVVGILYGKTPLLFGKSLEGSLGAFIVCFLLSAVWANLVLSVPWMVFALAGGGIGALAELFAFFDDNLTIPVLSGYFLSQIYFLLV